MRDVATPFMLELASVRKPVIAQVNGIAAGAGFSIVMACDFRITAENGSFLSAFIRIGLIPDSGLHYFLPRAVGLTRATEIMTLGEIIPAKKALEWGFVNRVVPLAELDDVVLQFAHNLVNTPTSDYWRTKM